MNFKKPKNLAQWLAFALSDPDKTKLDGSPAACTALSLVHVTGLAEKEIHPIKIGSRKYDDAGVVELAEMLQGLAETDAQNLPGVQQYVIYAFYEEQPGPGSRYVLRINGHVHNSFGDLATEPPTPEGFAAAHMRRGESLHQAYMAQSAQLNQMLLQFSSLMGVRLSETMRENRDMFEFSKDVLLRQVLDEREHQLKMAKMERDAQLLQAGIKYAPALINTITGKEVLPQSTSDSAILEGVAEVLMQQDAGADVAPLLQKLPAPLQAALMSRLEQIAQAKAAEQARVNAVMSPQDIKTWRKAETE